MKALLLRRYLHCLRRGRFRRIDQAARLVEAVVPYGMKAVPDLNVILVKRDTPFYIRELVANAMGRIGGDFTALALFLRVNDPNMPYMRGPALRALRQIGDEHSKRALASSHVYLQAEAESLIILVHKECDVPKHFKMPGKPDVIGSVLTPTQSNSVRLEELPLFATDLTGVTLPATAKDSVAQYASLPNVTPTDKILTNSLRFHLDDLSGDAIQMPFFLSGRQDLSPVQACVQIETSLDTWAEYPDILAAHIPRGSIVTNPFAKTAGERHPAVGDALPVSVSDQGREVYGFLRLTESLEQQRFMAELTLSQSVPLQPGMALRRRINVVLINPISLEAEIARIVEVYENA